MDLINVSKMISFEKDPDLDLNAGLLKPNFAMFRIIEMLVAFYLQSFRRSQHIRG